MRAPGIRAWPPDADIAGIPNASVVHASKAMARTARKNGEFGRGRQRMRRA
jgi:hypothetical protein